MWRFFLAFRCFFLVLFARRLPADAIALLPAVTPGPDAATATNTKATAQPAATSAPAPSVPTTDEKRSLEEGGAVRLLALLQREGRLVDFLQEEIDSYQDAQVGAAVRDIHRGCRKALAEYLALEPVMSQAEESTVRVEPGFDASTIRLVGEVVGAPPFTGRLRHAGWRARSVRLPASADHQDPTVIAPAEVELGAGGAA